ncbi:MAG: AI-2E family transporter [Flavobacteriales bacterium]|nr:MAG: AI-2E family transporter [Flavobacteriales bacterium]
MSGDYELKYPFYAKIAFVFITLFALTYTLWIAKTIIIPLAYATILAILLNPIINFLSKYRVPKVLAIGSVTVVSFTVLSTIIYLLIVQSTSFISMIPEMKTKFNEMSEQFLTWFSNKTNVQSSTIENWILTNGYNQLGGMITGKNITMAGQLAATSLLIPVYLCMILYFKPLFIEFIRKLFHFKHHQALEEVLASTKNIIQSYLVGLSLELVIVATLNAIGLYVLGIEYAILLGVLGAILNLIPYLGGILGVLVFMIVALVTKSPAHMIYVMVLYSFIQFIDNNLIVPRVVASRVQINALVSIIVVLIGGAIWGITGMFLSIPFIAIIKVIFDHIDGLRPWGFLLGDIVPTKKINFVKPTLKLVSKLIIPKKA